jgi:hypothetical protein
MSLYNLIMDDDAEGLSLLVRFGECRDLVGLSDVGNTLIVSHASPCPVMSRPLAP